LRTIYETLARLISPILPHTAEELWSYRSKGLGVDHKSIFLETFPQPIATDERRELPWDTIFKLRERIFAEIEKLRSEKVIRTNEEVWVILGTKQENILTAVENLEIIRDLCKVADVFWIPDPVVSDGFSVEVQKTKYAKCERCWRYRYEVEKNPERLCTRCSLVMAGRNGSRPKEIIGEQEQKQEARSA
jgi:isoleucyl-tRNA synthetase